MASPLLLVADDLALIAAVKRALTKEGHELVLATSAADAMVAYRHHQPALLLLQPSVERDQGATVLEELQRHFGGPALKVLLLGAPISGFARRVEPLPIDPAHLAKSVEETLRGGEDHRPEEAPAAQAEAEAGPNADDLEDALFGDLPSFEEELQRDIEAQTMAHLASLPKSAPDEELDSLEAEVRQEADRRRKAYEAGLTAPPVSLTAGANADTLDDGVDGMGEEDGRFSSSVIRAAEGSDEASGSTPPASVDSSPSGVEGMFGDEPAERGTTSSSASGVEHAFADTTSERAPVSSSPSGVDGVFTDDDTERGTISGPSGVEGALTDTTTRAPTSSSDAATAGAGTPSSPSGVDGVFTDDEREVGSDRSSGAARGTVSSSPSGVDGVFTAEDRAAPSSSPSGIEGPFTDKRPPISSSPSGVDGIFTDDTDERGASNSRATSAERTTGSSPAKVAPEGIAPAKSANSDVERGSEGERPGLENLFTESVLTEAPKPAAPSASLSNLFTESGVTQAPEAASESETALASPSLSNLFTQSGVTEAPEAASESESETALASPSLENLFTESVLTEAPTTPDTSTAITFGRGTAPSHPAASPPRVKPVTPAEPPPPSTDDDSDSELDALSNELLDEASRRRGQPPHLRPVRRPPPAPLDPPASTGEDDLEVDLEALGPRPAEPTAPQRSPPLPTAPVTAPLVQSPTGASPPPARPPTATPQPPQALEAMVAPSDDESSAAIAAAQAQLSAARSRREAHDLDEAALMQRLTRSEAQLRALASAEAGVREELAQAREQLEERDAQIVALEGELAQAQGQLVAARTGFADLQTALDAEQEAAAQLAAQFEALKGEANVTERLRHEADERLVALSRQLEESHAAHDATADELAAQSTRLRALEQELDAERGRQVQLEREAQDTLDRAQAQANEALEAEQARAKALEAALTASQADTQQLAERLEVSERERGAMTDEVHRLRDELAQLRSRLGEVDEELEDTRSRAEQAEAHAQLADQKVRELENRAVMPLALPGRQVVGIPRTGSASVDRLAQLIAQLAMAHAQVRVELGCPGGTRTLWLDKGRFVAAESSLPFEGLVDRARRDGLLDSRQEGELRMLRGASPKEQLDVLKTRGFVRDAEVVSLVQRYTEAIVLEALSEPTSHYRLVDGPPSGDVLSATTPRATLPLVAEALRRSLGVEELLEALGGSEAVPVPLESDLDLRALGFSERERKMLSWVNGESTVEDIALASGLKSDATFRALAVARALGVVDLKPPSPKGPRPAPELDVRRLEAKYEEVQEADYFTILGLPRSAGSDEVREARERLGLEFDPLKFSGHPDPSLQARAQVVFGLIEEASRALSDERRRAEYAQHLLD